MVQNDALVDLARQLMAYAFIGYLVATLVYVPGYIGYRISRGGARFARALKIAPWLHLVAVVLQAGAIIARWQGSGFWPTSNMFEFIGFMAFCGMVAFQVLNRIYNLPALGVLVAPTGLFILAYSYVFPQDVAPLIPALQSYWMPLHVSMAALGEGFFMVAFGAALLYLLRVRGIELRGQEQGIAAAAEAAGVTGTPHAPGLDAKAQQWGVRGLEFVFYLFFVFFGFTILAYGLRSTGHEWYVGDVTYHLPPFIGPHGAGVRITEAFGINLPLVEVPNEDWKAKNTNTLIFSLLVGYLLYGLTRLATRGPISDRLARWVGGNPETLDEVSYRAVAIGYPIFTLGGLVFAMLWAKEAWGRYWFWDPKETWALIAWLVYSAYLHARISHGWEGRKSAWIAVLGFGVVLFTLVGVNLLIVGLHSYAGGDM